MIAIVNYGVGNLTSIQNMLKKCGVESVISKDPDYLRKANKIILPGVGAFDTAMNKLKEYDLLDVLKEQAIRGIHLLGICLGAQLLLQRSEEGILPGLGLIKGECKKFDAKLISPLRVPHMGWSDVKFVKNHSVIDFKDVTPRFYFLHSYYLNCEDAANVLGISEYGHNFTCAIHHNNIFGFQFHPEKSHRFGLILLNNFAKF